MRLTRSVLGAGFLLSFVVAILLSALGTALLRREVQTVPDVSEVLASYRPYATSTMMAGDGTLLERFAEQDRDIIGLDRIPPIVRAAFISAEDRSFWTHRGVDPLAIVRAVVANFRSRGMGHRAVGASTITQQLAKNLVVGDEASLRRKVREAIVAMRMERDLGKERILATYLNQIYLGYGAYGVAAAARVYFDRPLEELDLAQIAFLAALPKGPANYDPIRRPAAALARRAYVIRRMLEDGAVTQQDARVANEAPLPRPVSRAVSGVAHDQFAEAARREVVARLGSTALYRDGLVIRTSLNPTLQEAAERVLRDGLAAWDRQRGWRGGLGMLPGGTRLDIPEQWQTAMRRIVPPQGAHPWRIAAVLGMSREAVLLGLADGTTPVMAMDGLRWARPAARMENGRPGTAPRIPTDVLRLGEIVLIDVLDGRPHLRQMPEIEGSLIAMETSTGRIVAVAGGFSEEEGAFNRATQARRQTGSTFKPFIYLTAFQNGWDPTSPVLDTPVGIDVGPGQQRWRPSGNAAGLITARRALEQSRNFAPVRLLHDLGIETVAATASRMGVYDAIPNYAAALGALETTSLRLTAGYAMIANGGRRVVPSFVDRIDGPDGTTVFERDRGGEVIVDPVAAAQLTSVLEGVVRRGTAVSALGRFPHAVAGKTGTTNENNDAWFVGFSPSLAVGVHVGYDRPRSLGSGGTGGHAAAPIWGAFMQEALAAGLLGADRFPVPEGVRSVRIDPNSGEEARNGVEEIMRN